MVDFCLILLSCLAGLASLFGEVTWLIHRLDRIVAFCQSLFFLCDCWLVGFCLILFVCLTACHRSSEIDEVDDSSR